jgi:hypothetical protein
MSCRAGHGEVSAGPNLDMFLIRLPWMAIRWFSYKIFTRQAGRPHLAQELQHSNARPEAGPAAENFAVTRRVEERQDRGARETTPGNEADFPGMASLKAHIITLLSTGYWRRGKNVGLKKRFFSTGSVLAE